MFDYILGLPMHALVIHAVVVLVPLTSLVALAFVARPGWRHLLRWPLVIGGVISGVTGFVAAESGQALERRVIAVRQSTTNLDLLREHTEWGDRAKIVLLVFMVICLVAAWFVRASRSDGTPTGASVGATAGTRAGTKTGARAGTKTGSQTATKTATKTAMLIQTRESGTFELPLLVLLAVGALAALVAVALTGHSGATVTWDGLG
ncbi:MAG: hypothetical protein ABI336_08955 [Humibacillus sp.]